MAKQSQIKGNYCTYRLIGVACSISALEMPVLLGIGVSPSRTGIGPRPLQV